MEPGRGKIKISFIMLFNRISEININFVKNEKTMNGNTSITREMNSYSFSPSVPPSNTNIAFNTIWIGSCIFATSIFLSSSNSIHFSFLMRISHVIHSITHTQTRADTFHEKDSIVRMDLASVRVVHISIYDMNVYIFFSHVFRICLSVLCKKMYIPSKWSDFHSSHKPLGVNKNCQKRFGSV